VSGCKRVRANIALPGKFPTHQNREFLGWSRESDRANREFFTRVREARFGGDARRRLKALSRELTGLSTEGVAALVPWNWSAHRARLRQERLVRMKISHARLRPYGGPPITRGNTGSRLMENDFDRESWVKVLYSIPRCQAGLV